MRSSPLQRSDQYSPSLGATGTSGEGEAELLRIGPASSLNSGRQQDRHPTALNAGAIELLGRSEAGCCCLLVAIGQRQGRIAIASNVRLRRPDTKLLSACRELPWRLPGLLQQLFHPLDRPTMLIWNVWPRVSRHRASVAAGKGSKAENTPRARIPARWRSAFCNNACRLGPRHVAANQSRSSDTEHLSPHGLECALQGDWVLGIH